MTEKNLQLIYGELISRCWEDAEFKKEFIQNTNKVLQEAGIPVEAGVEYKVVEAAANDIYVILPHEKVGETVRELTKLLLATAEKSEVIVPDGAKMIMLQNTKKTRYIVLKAAPDVLSDVELDMVVGGKDKNATANINYGINVNVSVNVDVAINFAAGVNVTAGAAFAVVAGAIVFI